ncbi:hypothetical protein DsansV1_C20g0163411 [Dioscorea sansibarensis]
MVQRHCMLIGFYPVGMRPFVSALGRTSRVLSTSSLTVLSVTFDFPFLFVFTFALLLFD